MGESMDDVARRLAGAMRIAVVGASDDPSRSSYGVMKRLIRLGRTIYPVNPNIAEAHGIRAYAALDELPEGVELVDVFRRPDYCEQVVIDAHRRGIPAVWLQSGVVSPEARATARELGMDFVEDRCLAVVMGQVGR